MSLGYKICIGFFWIMAAILGLASRIVLTYQSTRTKRELRAKRHAYARAWIWLARAYNRNLPRKAIEWVLQVRGSLDEWAFVFYSFVPLKSRVIGSISMLLSGVLGSIAFWHIQDHYEVTIHILFWVGVLLCVDLSLFPIGIGLVRFLERKKGWFIIAGGGLARVELWVVLMVCPLYWLKFVLGFSPLIGTLVLFASLGTLYFLFSFAGRMFLKNVKVDGRHLETGWVAMAFPTTMFAFWLGTLFSPISPLPQNMQMLLVNVVCDFLTLYFTFLILRTAICKKPKFTILTAILIDIWVAIILASISLWLGTFQWGDYMGIQELIMALVGRNATGTAWEFGPYFWAMHTTFIPTLLYFGVIFTLYVARMAIKMRGCWLKRSNIGNQPYSLTANVMLIHAGIFVIIGGIMKWWHEFSNG